MKKILSVLFACLLIISLLPTRTFAADVKNPTIESLINLGCETFPEYSEKIIASSSIKASRSTSDEKLRIVVQETRSISDNQELTYIELSNREVLLANNHYTVDADQTSQETGTSGVVTYTYNFSITRLSSAGTFALNNFRYKIYPNNYDSIVSPGIVSTNPGCTATRDVYTQYETASKPAQVSYGMVFVLGQSGTDAFQGDFIIKVQNNRMSYSVVDYEA